jgi:hypothetical protein
VGFARDGNAREVDNVDIIKHSSSINIIIVINFNTRN